MAKDLLALIGGHRLECSIDVGSGTGSVSALLMQLAGCYIGMEVRPAACMLDCPFDCLFVLLTRPTHPRIARIVCARAHTHRLHTFMCS
jgi:hypothetical protein